MRNFVYKKLVREGYIEKHGDRKNAYYVKAKNNKL